jgi:two-component system, cell cycle sensor histidine kinase and response regulator CckA
MKPKPISPAIPAAGATADESGRMLRLIIDHLPGGVFWKDRQSRFLGCNAAFAQAFGLTPGQITGLDDHHLRGVTPEQARFFVARDREVMESGTPQLGIIEPLTRADGTTLWLETHKTPLRDAAGNIIGILGTWQDITARKRAEEAVRDSKQRLRLATETAAVGIWEWNISTNQIRWDAQMFRIYGIDPTPDGFVELNDWSGAVHPADLQEQLDVLQNTIRTKGQSRREFRIQRRDNGQERFIHAIETVRLNTEGAVEWVVGTNIDITDRRRAEEERRQLEAQIQHAQKLESLGILAGGIAHDFNNILTSILGYADLALLELPPYSPARSLIGEAVHGARQATELTKQMLAYSGKGRFVVESLNLNALVEDMAHLLQVSITKKCVLKYRFLPDLPPIEADATQIRQIIMNLIINASEAIGERSGVITVGTGAMHCDRAYLSKAYLDENLAEGTYVFLEVADTGCGMSEETRTRIFDPFFTTKVTGRGLGLAAVLGIVRGHKGAIKVYSERDKGTTLKVILPASAKSAAAGPADTPHATAWRGSGTALVVDDEESVRGLAAHMLEMMGFTVLTASDGREGLEVYRREADRIRFVLLDMTMPHLDGSETFREMRRIRDGVKAILTSGYNEQAATGGFAGKGLASFIQKPYRYEDLLHVVRSVLENAAQP